MFGGCGRGCKRRWGRRRGRWWSRQISDDQSGAECFGEEQWQNDSQHQDYSMKTQGDGNRENRFLGFQMGITLNKNVKHSLLLGPTPPNFNLWGTTDLGSACYSTKSCSGCFTVSTGQGAKRTTFSAVEPNTRWLTPL